MRQLRVNRAIFGRFRDVRCPSDSDQIGDNTRCRLSAIGDIARLFDHLVGQRERLRRHFKAQKLGGPQIDHEFEFGWLHDR